MSHTTVSIREGGKWIPVDASQIQRTHTAPGGCGPASFVVSQDVMVDAARLGADALVRIDDRRTATTLWSGRVEKTTRLKAGVHVSCTGSSSELTRAWFSLPYLVTRNDAWEPAVTEPSSPAATVEIGAMLDQQTPGVTFKWAYGARNMFDRARAEFTGMRDTDCTIGACVGYADAGFTDNAEKWRMRWYVAFTGWDNCPINLSPTETATRYAAASGSEEFPRGQREMSVAMHYISSTPTTYAESYQWGVWYGLRVWAERYDRDGGYQVQVTDQGLQPHWVVEDLLWRMRSVLARDEARTPRWSDPTGFTFDELDLRDPITPAEVLNAVVCASNSSTWMVGPADDTDGLCPLEVRSWGDLAYVVPADAAEWDDTGDDSYYNWAAVEWSLVTPRRTLRRLYRYPQETWARGDEWPEVENIEDAPRSAPLVKLTSAQASASRAAALARAIFLNSVRRARGGKVTITEPIVDYRSGATRYPWELEPGVMVWVPGEPAYLRCTAIDFDDDAGTAVLTVGNPRKSTDDLVAAYTRRTTN